MKAEEEGIFKVSELKDTSSISSPDSESSFVDKEDKIQHKPESNSEGNSEKSIASLKKRLQNLPSPSENSPFCDDSVASTRFLQKEREFFYHLQELSNSIEEKDEAEVSSASSETRISSVIGSRLQNPRARRRAKMLQEASKIENASYLSKLSTDSEKDSVTKSSRSSSQKVISNLDNREDSEFSPNSSSDGRLRNKGAHNESGKLSSRSNLTSSEEGKRYLYRNDLKNKESSSVSPSSPMNFPGTFPILPKSIKISRKVGGYRPASVLLQDLSSESESDTGNDQILQNLMLERLDDIIKFQSKVIQANLQSSTESNSSFAKLRDSDFLSEKEVILNEVEDFPQMNRIETIVDFGEIAQNQRLEKMDKSKDILSTFSTPRKKISSDFPKSVYSTSISNRSHLSDTDRRVTRIPSLVSLRTNKNVEEDSPYSAKSNSARQEINFRRRTFIFPNEETEVPLEIRSENVSPSGNSKEKNQSLKMKTLLAAASDKSLSAEKPCDDSEKLYFGHQKSEENSRSPSQIPERIFAKSSPRIKAGEVELSKIPRLKSISPGQNSDNSSTSNIGKIKNASSKDPLKFPSAESDREILKGIFTSRSEYSEVKSPRDKRSTRSFELTPFSSKITRDKNYIFSLKDVDVQNSEDSISNPQNENSLPTSPKGKSTTLAEDEDENSDKSIFTIEENMSNIEREPEDSKENMVVLLSDKTSSNSSSIEGHNQKKNDWEKGISPVTKLSSSLKLNPIPVLKTSEKFFFEPQLQDLQSSLISKKIPNHPNVVLLPAILKNDFSKDSKQLNQNSPNQNADKLSSTGDNCELIDSKSAGGSSEEKFLNRESRLFDVQNQFEKDAISEESLKNRVEYCIGDSNHQGPIKWAFRREIGPKGSHENNYHLERNEKEERSSFHLIERSVYFNSMKLAKSDSTTTLTRKSSNLPNLPTKNSASMSKLTCLLDSMKKETQDRFPFTISESTSQNSSKLKVENDKHPIKETLPEFEEESGETSYKLDRHPSITRLAFSGTEPHPSELISSVSYESPSQARNFLPRVRSYMRRFSVRLKKKNGSKTRKPDPAKFLFKNSECLESAGSSGNTVELPYLNEIQYSKGLTKQSRKSKNDSDLKESDKCDHNNDSFQRFHSEIESSRLPDFKSRRVRSSPVNIKNRRGVFPRAAELASEEFDEIALDKKVKEIPMLPSPKKEVSSDDIRPAVQELPSQSNIETSCFCFKMCRNLVQPSMASSRGVYLSPTRTKISKWKKP